MILLIIVTYMYVHVRVVANNLKSLEVSEEKAVKREASYRDQIKILTNKLKQNTAGAEFAERSVQKLQKEVEETFKLREA